MGEELGERKILLETLRSKQGNLMAVEAMNKNGGEHRQLLNFLYVLANPRSEFFF
jgi:hypothetical protein